MKTLFSKRLIYRLTGIRIFAIAFLLGVTGFWIWHWQNQTQPMPNAFIVTFPPEPPKPESILQDRNLNEYEQINISNCRNRIINNYQSCLDELDNGRMKILNYWKERKQTYILYSCAGYHGEVDIHIFIEPDDFGTWRIVQRWETYYTTVGWENLFKVSSTEAFSIKSVRKAKDDDINAEGKFYLKFFDKNGEQVDIL